MVYMKENTSEIQEKYHTSYSRDVILKDEIKTLVRRSGQKTKKGKENFNICSHSEKKYKKSSLE